MYVEVNSPSESFDIIIPSNAFKSMTLDKFCVKRYFEIGFINSATAEDEHFLRDLVQLNKIKEKITHVTIIDKHEVEKFIADVSLGKSDFEYPPSLIDEVRKFSQFNDLLCCNDTEINNEYESYSMKFKLIHVMYEQYADVVKEMRRQERMNHELDILAEKKTPGSRGKKSNIDVKSKQSTGTSVKSAKKMEEKVVLEDYTDVEIQENDLVVDDAIKEKVFFYLFKGYDDINIVKHLMKTNVKLSFIIQLSEYEPEEYRQPNHFWEDVKEVRACPCDYLQNIAIMKYQPPLHDDTNIQLEVYLKELLQVIKSVIDLKRQHFQYIKLLKIVDTKFTETFKTFPVYEKILDNYPLETITIPLIINSIIQEVQMKSDNILKSSSFNEQTKPAPRHEMPCPFDINSYLRKPETKTNQKKASQTFKIYDRDMLNLTFKTYRQIGYRYVQDNLNILKLQLPVTLAQQCVSNEDTDDYLIHTHDVFVPGDDDPSFTDEQVDHLINLLYLKNKGLHKSELKKSVGNEFTKNLIFHDEYRNVQNMLPKCLFKKTPRTPEPFVDEHPNSNVYEAIRPMALHWAEILSTDVLFQYLFDSQLKFLCCDYINCELTKSLLIRFHNDVDSFGLNTKVWKEYLRTPVGLADFCKFTLLDDYNWLKNNRIFSQITYQDVVKMLEDQTAMRLYGDDINKDYKSLLVPQIQYSCSDIRKFSQCPCIEENVCRILETCNDETVNYPDLSANLEVIFQDLEEYKNILDFSEHCKRKEDKEYSFTAYNFGVTKFSIIGHTTNFISLDDVRVTVDSSRFCNEKFKLTIKIMFDDNLLVLHTPQKTFNFHVVLSDGTLIVFSQPSTKQKELTEIQREDSDPTVLDLEGAVVDVEQSESTPFEVLPQNVHHERLEDEHKITAVDFNHYSSLKLYPIVGNVIRETPTEMHKTNLTKEMGILKRLQQNTKCLKVSRKSSRNFKYLEKRIPETNVAMSNVVRRIIENPEKLQNCDLPARKCLIKGDMPPRKSNETYDCFVTFPNGLTIKVLPSEILPNSTVIRQSYEYAVGPKEVSEEQYRMFTKDGTIIIGKMDGSISLLMSSGKEIRFDRPTTSNNEKSCRFEMKLNEQIIRKLITRLMSTREDQACSDYYISRRGHLNSKSTSVSSCESLNELSRMPYSIMSLISYEGEKITLKNKKLYKVLHSRHTSEINFQTEERSFKREDGFRSRTDRDGTHFVEFPDGTTIKTVIHVEEEPIRVNKRDKMGWILVTSTFVYEHDFYKPVFFDNFNSYIEIRLNEQDFLVVTKDGGSLSMKNSAVLDIKADLINFTKDCPHCESRYNCRLNIDPLYSNKHPETGAVLVDAEDSYNKKFKADFFGNCQVVPTYISGGMNKNGCHHVAFTDNQKVYLVKNDLSGMLLWNDKAASTVMKECEQDKNIRHFNDVRNTLIFLTVTKNVYTKFDERFFGKILRELDQYNSDATLENRTVVYQITRNLYSMFELDQVDGLMRCLKKFFQEELMKELAGSLSSLKFHLKTSKYSIHSLTQTYVDGVEEVAKPTISLQEKIMELSRKDAQVKKIFRTPIPNYFNSKFCTFVEPSRMSSSSKRSTSRTQSMRESPEYIQL